MSIEKSIKQLKTQNYTIKTSDGKEFSISKEGSLGLLALGYRGIIAWKRAQKINE